MESPVEIGSMLAGKYRIERVIGHGGMGIVVAATHDELDQRVAIKFLSPENAKGSDWISRFAREAKAAAKIKNEHAVKVFDVGRMESGIPYMVMEYLDGRNLDEILEEHRTLSIEDTIDYILQACEALAEAHLVGIVHRDLKPANLFLTNRSDGTTFVKILDFGISKVEETLAVGVITHTQSLVGSPLYMSPERLKGAKDVDRRADIWSLGVMLQEMLTGSPSFLADTIPEVHAMVLTNPPTPLRRGCPAAPPELEAVVLKCLEKSPEARFQNVHEFALALGAISPASQGSVERIARTTVGGSGKRARVSNFPNSSVSGSFPPAAKLAVTESLPTVSATAGTFGDALRKSNAKWALVAGVVVIALVTLTVLARRHPTPSHATIAPPPTTTHAPSPVVPATTTATTEPVTTTAATITSIAEPEETVVDPKDHVGHVRRVRNARDAGASAISASASVTPPPPSATQEVIDYGGRN